jgi:hypothetical protein
MRIPHVTCDFLTSCVIVDPRLISWIAKFAVAVSTCTQGNRAKRTVWRKGYIISLTHTRNSSQFRDTPNMANIWLQDVHRARLQKSLDIPSAMKPLAESNWCQSMLRKEFDAFEILGKEWFFDEERLVRL